LTSTSRIPASRRTHDRNLAKVGKGVYSRESPIAEASIAVYIDSDARGNAMAVVDDGGVVGVDGQAFDSGVAPGSCDR
jgi:hypothetical protein